MATSRAAETKSFPQDWFYELWESVPPIRRERGAASILTSEEASDYGIIPKQWYESLKTGDWVESKGYVAPVIFSGEVITRRVRDDGEPEIRACAVTPHRVHRLPMMKAPELNVKSLAQNGGPRSPGERFYQTRHGYAVDHRVYKFVKCYSLFKDPFLAARSSGWKVDRNAKLAIASVVAILQRADTRKLMSDEVQAGFREAGATTEWAARLLKDIAEDDDTPPRDRIQAVKEVLAQWQPRAVASASLEISSDLIGMLGSSRKSKPDRAPEPMKIDASAAEAIADVQVNGEAATAKVLSMEKQK